MNKKLLGIIIVIAVLISGGTAFLLMDGKKQPQPASQTSAPSNESLEESEEAATTVTENPGTYVDYNENALTATEGTKILFFYAPWCPQCRALEADILDKGVPPDVTIFKVDYDTNQDLRQKYGVTIQTTLVKVDADGTFIKKFVAYDDPALESVKENLL